MATDKCAMEARENLNLLSIASPWPIAITLATYLPAGDLINLARTSLRLRAALHGLQPPSVADLLPTPQSKTRPFLCIGSHQTSYWKQLKQAAPFLCASPTHTKGSSPRPCRFCSTPICEACIVKDSFAKRAENTFKNRCRFLCKDCWTDGHPHKRCRFTGEQNQARNQSFRYNFAPGEGEFCGCTNKDDGWVCISCKNMQNAEANTNGFKLCFGEGCSKTLEEDKDRRRICLWCDRPMLRGRASMESRLAFDQKIQDAKTKRGLSFEEWTRKQQKLYKMSRRELRGDEAVAQDCLADAPQFVRHLDTTNYQRYMPREHTPSGEQVYLSKLGRWVYNREFLLAIGQRCKKLPKRNDVTDFTKGDGEQLERTNFDGTDFENWFWRFEKYGKKSEQLRGKRLIEQDDVAVWRTSSKTTHGLRRRTRSNHMANGVEFQNLRSSFIFAAEANAGGDDQADMLQGYSSEEINEDQALAMALQAELDQEMAEALEAEFIADAAEEGAFTQLDHGLQDSESDEGYSVRPFSIRTSAMNAGSGLQGREHALEGQQGVAGTSRIPTQLDTPQLTTPPDIAETRKLNVLHVVGSLLAPELALDSETACDVDPTMPQSQPQTNVDKSDDELKSQHSPAQLSERSLEDDRPPSYSG